MTVQANRLHTGSCLCCNYGQFKTTNPLKCDILPHNTRNETKQYPETKAWEMYHKKDFIAFAEVLVVQSAEHWGSRYCKHVHPLCNIKHANISIDVIIYVAGTTHMLKISICSSALQIWNQNTHPYSGSSPVILQKCNGYNKFCAPFVYNIAQRSPKT